jgi:iron(III) transport system permease protein
VASLAPDAGRTFATPSLRWDAGAWLRILLLVSVAAVVLIPLVMLILNSFQVARPNEAPAYSLDAWRIALSEPGILKALINTATLTAARQAIALAIAVFFAWLIARTDVPGRSSLEFAFWTVFFLPALPMTLGWILMLDPYFGLLNTWIAKLTGLRPFNIYTWWGIVWVHLVTGTIAIKVVLLIPAFRNLDSSFEEASRMCGVGTRGTFWRISVPLILPAIVIVTLMSVASSLQAFEVELILGPQAGIDVYSTIMYRFISQEPAQFGPATALGVLVMVGMLPFALWQYRLVTRRSYTTVTGVNKSTRVRLGRWRWLLFAVMAVYLLVALVIPTVLLVLATFMKFFGAFDAASPWTLQQWHTVLTDATFLRSLVNTLILGGGAGALAVVWFSLAAYVIVRYRGALGRTLDFLCWLPWAIPGVIMGLGFLWMVLGIGFLRPLHSTMAVMILAATLGAITPGTQMVKAALLQIHADLEGASRVGGGSWLYTFRRVVVPLLMPTLVAVGILTFVSAVRDIGRIVFVVGGTNRPLALLQLDLMVSERFEAAAVVGLIVTLLSIGVATLARLSLRPGDEM